MSPVGNHTDAELVMALHRGDRKAFETMYRKYVSDLYRYARKNIPAKEDCEEIIQEVFESLWERHESLAIQTSLKGYLMGMVRYKIIHYFRKSALKKKYAEHFMLFEAVYAEGGGENSNHADIQAAIEKVMNDLPDRCREALRLRLSEELSNRDIAIRMNITTRTVEGYMFHAYNHIRMCYRLDLDE